MHHVVPLSLEIIGSLRNRLKDGLATLKARFAEHANAEEVLHGRCRQVDQVLQELWEACGISQQAALIAVGGYGRGELYPYSDVDILILLPTTADSSDEERITSLVGWLWDVGLEIGHSVRTLSECLDEASRDITIQTNLLESRLITGDASLFGNFNQELRSHLNKASFFKAKQLEQTQRYTRHNLTPYALEPNCKESPGGLRDLQIISWVGEASGMARGWDELVAQQIFNEQEAQELKISEEFLRILRIRLHFLAGRREDKLLFDHQEKLAQLFGFTGCTARRASEELMQRYYKNAKLIVQLNTVFLLNFAELLNPSKGAAIVISEHFQTVRDLLDVRDEHVFERDPSAIFRLFIFLQQRSELKGITARSVRALWRARLIVENEAFRNDPQMRKLFVQILQSKRGVTHELRRMNHYGILGRYLPAWRQIVGQMQHDLFHAYTVDQHTLQVLRNVRRFTTADHAHEYPLLSRLITSFPKNWAITIAALFHDIAKGRGGDHSKKGMVDADDFCALHGIEADDRELIVWLVENHLNMSTVAQKQDLTDPETIERFAALVKDERHLTALYILTHADIRGTSPKVWNGWKGKLLEDLFFATQRVLRGVSPGQAVGSDDRQREARSLLRYYGLRPNIEDRLWKELDTVYFMRHDAEEIGWHTRNLYYRADAGDPAICVRPSQVSDGLQVMVYTPDTQDLFLRLSGYFSRKGFSILDAKIHTTRHGYALDSFILELPGEEEHYRELCALIEHELMERLRPESPLDRPVNGRLSRLLKAFPIQPEVRFEPDERNQYHTLSITAADRPGLLFSVAETLAKYNINLHTAKIATLGDRVEDTFLVSGRCLYQDSTLLRVEQELLEKIATV